MSKKVSFYGLILAVALIFSYIEFLIPFNFGIPGIKLGLCNSIVLYLLYKSNIKSAIVINILRIIISGILFGNVYGIIYSLSGAFFALLIMIITKKIKCFSIIGVSISGAVFNNFGQIIAAVILLSTPQIFTILPILTISGIITGSLIGIVTNLILTKVK